MYSEKSFALNTSNPGKQKEFKELFGKKGWNLDFASIDLNEIEASPLEVIVHKASQMPDHVIVEDTSLDVQDAKVGINVKYLLDNLESYVDKKASWNVFLAFKDGETVYVFQGKVDGTLVLSRGSGGWGFDPNFQPEGSLYTLAELNKPDEFNARAIAVSSLIEGKPFYKGPTIKKWEGPWQQNPN